MRSYRYEWRVEPCPTAMMSRAGEPDGWGVDDEGLESMLNKMDAMGFGLQPESRVQPHGMLLFKKSVKLSDAERIDSVTERLFDPAWYEEADAGLCEEITRLFSGVHDRTDARAVVRAVLSVGGMP